ncbi:MAG: hypothetical protein QJR06_02040 [Alicyclobacillaceae bacterium]|nr:hypothetical protein [Alicyclobacillaceae bacterium]
MPLHWEEVKSAVPPETWTLRLAADRVRREGDLFAPVLGPGVDVRPLLDQLDKLQEKRSS